MFNLYQYNSRSEVVDAVRYFGSNTNDTTNPVGLQDWSYSYDNIGNRSGTMKANAAANYTANALNQYTERTVHGSADILGSAEQDVTITVNEEEASRQDYYPPSPLRCSGLWRTSWYHRLIVDNLFAPIYTQVVVEAIYDPGTNDPYVVSSETGSVFVAETPEVFTYDDDGNLLSDGCFDYAWDGENRLIAVTTAEGLPEDMPVVHVEFAYDYMSRRVGKQVYEWDDGGTNWVEQSSATFVYDGWNFVRSTTLSNDGVITNMFVWGLDLASATLSHDGVSGSLQGAGGIGGLLASVGGAGSPSTPVFYTYDGNGNVSELINADGEIVAHYEYSPFGETIVSTGPLAKGNPFRFSTKYFDDETGLAYYGYRFYSSGLGRWVNRDPIEEEGGWNLYGFVKNSPPNKLDLMGLQVTGWPKIPPGVPIPSPAEILMRLIRRVLQREFESQVVPIEFIDHGKDQECGPCEKLFLTHIKERKETILVKGPSLERLNWNIPATHTIQRLYQCLDRCPSGRRTERGDFVTELYKDNVLRYTISQRLEFETEFRCGF